jgi:large subunit ribosomal protein L22
MIRAKLRYLRIAPRKVRLVADLIRGKGVEEAQDILNFTVKKAAQPLLKLLKSALSSASNQNLNKENLYISKITVDEGPKYKRWRARARGQAYQIQKKTSHITLFLEEKIKKPKREIRRTERETPESRESVLKTEKEVQKREKIRPLREIAQPKVERKGLRRIFRRKSI